MHKHNLLSFRAAGVGALLLAGWLMSAGAARADQPRLDGQTIIVDDDKKECPEAQFTDLRLAALAALPGATILVCPGFYPGPVVVTRQLTFIAVARADAGKGNREGSNREARRRSATDSSREAIVQAGPLGDEFALVANSAGTVIDGFVITSVDGIQMSPRPFTPAAGNTLTDNHARNDTVFDCEDQSKGPGTAGTANFWINDQGKTADPPGICH